MFYFSSVQHMAFVIKCRHRLWRKDPCEPELINWLMQKRVIACVSWPKFDNMKCPSNDELVKQRILNVRICFYSSWRKKTLARYVFVRNNLSISSEYKSGQHWLSMENESKSKKLTAKYTAAAKYFPDSLQSTFPLLSSEFWKSLFRDIMVFQTSSVLYLSWRNKRDNPTLKIRRFLIKLRIQ